MAQLPHRLRPLSRSCHCFYGRLDWLLPFGQMGLRAPFLAMGFTLAGQYLHTLVMLGGLFARSLRCCFGGSLRHGLGRNLLDLGGDGGAVDVSRGAEVRVVVPGRPEPTLSMPLSALRFTISAS
ncbi:hypothetical protein B296_00009855 [Ensete ventricosum]|uniref:Uncharacterized protein n=1 Tax=Ensete ventricosum TaxID=4639 RepID=A0A427AJY7_ENSVE|nr:hypothetical protein B296_00009855 [Ensete ventricosum]